MDKILSARVDEAIIKQIGLLADRLRTTKKAVIEGAITSYAEKIAAEKDMDLLKLTAGSWKRDETVEETVSGARKLMRVSMERHSK